MEALTPIDLRCEHLFAPQGLNTRQPRLTWGLEGTGRDRRQSGYRIVVGYDRMAVAEGRGSHWDSGRINSSDTLLIPYAGKRLRPDETLYWTVQVWDEAGIPSGFAKPAVIRTGLMEQADWAARWMARAFYPPGGRMPPQDTAYDNPYSARPADFFRREFAVDRPIRRATAYATALGLYELRLNGSTIGDQVLAPGWTDYHTRVEYQSYDVTNALLPGANAIGIILGEGWYCGRVSIDQKHAAGHYGSRPAALCQLHIEYEDGSIEIVASGPDWRCANEAIVYSDLLLGEKYDARLEQPGWDRAGFRDEDWWQAEDFTPRPGWPKLDAARGVPTRRIAEMPARFLHTTQTGGLIFDLGQNIAGYSRLEIEAPRDATFILRHGEALSSDGELYTANLRWALSTDTYISKGGRQVFEPRFTVHGFRFVELTVPDGFAADDIKLAGIVVHSDMPVTGSFASGHEMLDRLMSNIEWTQRDNFLSVPTDCPQRDERMGWLGDAQVFFRTASYNMDVSGFFTKWLQDIYDAQTAEGAFTDVAPSQVYTRFRPEPPRGAPGWGDGGILIPWRMYERYGDIDILNACYDGMVRWLDFIEMNNPDHVRDQAVFSNWGDWLSLGPATPKALFSTAYWALQADVMARTAALLGRRQDEARFQALFRDVRAAFRTRFMADDGRLEGDTQTAYVMALAIGLYEEDERKQAAALLLRSISAAADHIRTGIHGISWICPVLAECGEAATAYDLMLNESYPSWIFSIRQGATTIWERWDGWTPERGFQSVNMNSLNHYALGAVGEFVYGRVAGIDLAPGTAGRRAILRPLPDQRLGWCRASYRSHCGTIASHWRYEGPDLFWDVTIPPNCTATIEIPPGTGEVRLDGAVLEANVDSQIEIGSGEYHFMLRSA